MINLYLFTNTMRNTKHITIVMLILTFGCLAYSNLPSIGDDEKQQEQYIELECYLGLEEGRNRECVATLTHGEVRIINGQSALIARGMGESEHI